MFYFWRGATAALVPGFLCQSGRRHPENVSILSSLLWGEAPFPNRGPRVFNNLASLKFLRIYQDL